MVSVSQERQQTVGAQFPRGTRALALSPWEGVGKGRREIFTGGPGQHADMKGTRSGGIK